MKFLIVNAWSDLNRGDSAIVLGTLRLLRNRFPSSSTYLMSEFAHEDPNFSSAHQALQRYFPELIAVPALFPYINHPSHLRKISLAALTIFKALVALALPRMGHFVYKGRTAGAWKAVAEADVVISKGGHIFYMTTCSPRSVYGFFKHAFPLLLAARLKKPTIIYAQSVGPFAGLLAQLLAKLFFNRLTAISVRESISLTLLNDLGISTYRCVVPDAAFLLKIDDPLHDVQVDDKLVVITPRQWFPSRRNVFTNYLRVLAHVIQWLTTEGYKVLLVSHTVGPTPIEDDRIAVQLLQEQAGASDHLKTIDTSAWTAYDMIRLYASAQLLIGTRFHSVLFALLAGTPAIAISYFGPKSVGIMESLSLSHLVFDIERLEYEPLRRTVQQALAQRSQLRDTIRQRIGRLCVQAERDGINFLELAIRGLGQ